jgi:Family of unknown function (DUF6459)
VLPSHTAQPNAMGTVPPMRPAPAPPARLARVAVRLLAVPDHMPPYDGAATPATPARPATATPTRAAVFRPPDANQTLQPAGWPGQFAQVLAETLAGSRPAEQLRPWTTEQARRRIRQLCPVLAAGQRPRVRKIMTSAPSPDAVEMTAIVGFGPRTRVLAFRLERAGTPLGTSQRRGLPPRPERQQWLCTAIESA